MGGGKEEGTEGEEPAEDLDIWGGVSEAGVPFGPEEGEEGQRGGGREGGGDGAFVGNDLLELDELLGRDEPTVGPGVGLCEEGG